MNKLSLLVVLASVLLSSCATPKYTYHSVYKLSGCGKQVTRENLAQALIHKGYLKSSQIKGPYEIFKRPEIVKKGPLAAEPYEDRSGEIAIAVCPGGSESYILVEEWQGCKDRKDCTEKDQRDLRRVAEDWACQVSEKSGRSKSWKLEERQDWTKESCSFIATNLIF
ncbi:MAG: hypothetical protein AB1540_11715 [Bdellovibrionota bacterium]